MAATADWTTTEQQLFVTPLMLHQVNGLNSSEVWALIKTTKQSGVTEIPLGSHWTSRWHL